jgi:hypothetical protein
MRPPKGLRCGLVPTEPRDSCNPSDIALADEYLALKARLLDARERADRLRKLAHHLEDQVARDEHALQELEGALGVRAQLQIEELDRELRGRRVQEVAVEVLQRSLGFGKPVHYKDWYALLRAAGYHVKGKDPVASFLAQISKAEGVEPLGQRSGKYRLRPVA